MSSNQYQGKWEKRWHPLRREWVVYAAHRNQRPWSGASAATAGEQPPAFDPDCHFCPGNKRISGIKNPDYQSAYVFVNDHPVVGPAAPSIPPARRSQQAGLYQRSEARGIAKVVCYDPRHNVTLAEMDIEKVVEVFDTWQQEMHAFTADPDIHSVLIFENKGKAVGVSNPHPHCQIYATDFPFRYVELELACAADYRRRKGRNIFQDILSTELNDGSRIIAEREEAVAFVPFFARYAYEVMVFPRRRHATLTTLTEQELRDMAQVFQEVIRRYDLNFQMSFPYVLSVMQAPVNGDAYPDYHLHLHLQPPLRQPDLLKFLAGPEIGGGNFMADTIPEEKAAELQAVDLHKYRAP